MDHLKETFAQLVETVRQRYPNIAVPGCHEEVAEERRGDDTIMFEMYDGAMTQFIKSRKYGLMLTRRYTFKEGDVLEFAFGTEEDLNRLVDDLRGFPHADHQ